MRSLILFIFTALTFQACNNPRKTPETTDSSKSDPAHTVIANQEPVNFEGLYTPGEGVETLRDCNGNKIYWINDSTASLRQQYEKVNRFPPYPFESVYAEVKGYLAGKSKSGYASAYENVLVVTEILKVEPKNFRTECYNYEFIALGNEPFWSVDIIPGEKRIVFKDAGLERATEFMYAPAKVSDGIHRYEATSRAGFKLLLIISEQKCSDGMSDRTYSYSAELTVDGRVYKGCAIRKGEKFDRP